MKKPKFNPDDSDYMNRANWTIYTFLDTMIKTAKRNGYPHLTFRKLEEIKEGLDMLGFF